MATADSKDINGRSNAGITQLTAEGEKLLQRMVGARKGYANLRSEHETAVGLIQGSIEDIQDAHANKVRELRAESRKRAMLCNEIADVVELGIREVGKTKKLHEKRRGEVQKSMDLDLEEQSKSSDDSQGGSTAAADRTVTKKNSVFVLHVHQNDEVLAMRHTVELLSLELNHLSSVNSTLLVTLQRVSSSVEEALHGLPTRPHKSNTDKDSKTSKTDQAQ